MAQSKRERSGGSIGAGGYGFQNRIAAWYAVRILAEQSADPGLQLPADVTLDAIHCEAPTEVDDLVVETSRGTVYVQAKRSLSVSEDLKSEFSSVLAQFTRQHLKNTLRSDTSSRPDTNRYALAVSDEAPNTIRVYLRNVLNEVRQADPQALLEEVPVNQQTKSVLEKTRACIRAAWQQATECEDEPTESFYRDVLELTYVQEFRFSDGQSDEVSAKDTLRQTVLQDPTQADAAWSDLLQDCFGLIEDQGSADRQRLQERLLGHTFGLRTVKSFEKDIESLEQLTERTLAELAESAQLQIGDTTLQLKRHCTQALRGTIEHSSLFVVGEPGAGKSGVLHALVSQLLAEKRDVVFLSVERVQELESLEHEVVEVLQNWLGTEPAFFVVDALDAVRGSEDAKRLRGMLKRLSGTDSRWRIIASIRRFDLRYDAEWQRLFGKLQTAVDPNYQYDEFSRYSHFRIPELTDNELGELAQQNAMLSTSNV